MILANNLAHLPVDNEVNYQTSRRVGRKTRSFSFVLLYMTFVWWNNTYLSKKSETVYRPIWGILKLSVVLNQNILKLSFRCIPYVPKPSITSRKFWNCPSELNISETQKLSIRNKNWKLSGVKTPDKWLLIHPRSCQKEFTSFLSIFLRIFRKKVKDYF